MAKSPNAFRTISEAADEVGTPQHVLRFWETKFAFLAPVKRAGGRRFYRPQDIVVLKAIKTLLHDQGLTIRGVQKLHKEQGLRRLAAYGDPEGTVVFEAEPVSETPAGMATTPGIPTVRLRQVLAELEGARARLEVALSRSA